MRLFSNFSQKQNIALNYNENMNIEERLQVLDNRKDQGCSLIEEDLYILLNANWDFEFIYNNTRYEVQHDKDNIFLFDAKNNIEIYNADTVQEFINNTAINNIPFSQVWSNSSFL